MKVELHLTTPTLPHFSNRNWSVIIHCVYLHISTMRSCSNNLYDVHYSFLLQPKEVGPVTLQRASGKCRHPRRGGRSGKRSGWTVDTGSLERRPYRMPSMLDCMRINEQCSRWRKLQRSTQPSSKPSARGCRRLDTATLCHDPAIQALTL